MSEFSASIHILHNTENELAELLRKNKLEGVIIGSNDSTITLITEQNNFEKIQSLTTSITFEFAEDHGLMMNFASEGKNIGHLIFKWGDFLSFDISTNLEIKLMNHNFIPQEKIFILKQAFRYPNFNNFDYDIIHPMVREYTEHLNLFAYDNLSYEYFQRHEEIYREQYPDLKVITKKS